MKTIVFCELDPVLPALRILPHLITTSLCVVTIVVPILLVKNARVKENNIFQIMWLLSGRARL